MKNIILIVVHFEHSFMFLAFVLMVLYVTSTIAHTLVCVVMHHQAKKT
jgi:hypothetical protein